MRTTHRRFWVFLRPAEAQRARVSAGSSASPGRGFLSSRLADRNPAPRVGAVVKAQDDPHSRRGIGMIGSGPAFRTVVVEEQSIAGDDRVAKVRAIFAVDDQEYRHAGIPPFTPASPIGRPDRADLLEAPDRKAEGRHEVDDDRQNFNAGHPASLVVLNQIPLGEGTQPVVHVDGAEAGDVGQCPMGAIYHRSPIVEESGSPDHWGFPQPLPALPCPARSSPTMLRQAAPCQIPADRSAAT
jgi:hypothetical protein